jgi:hypothetical protein
VLDHPADMLEAELLRVRLAGSMLSQRHNRGRQRPSSSRGPGRGVFVSEDRDARVLAAGELGPGRVIGTPELLGRAVLMGLLAPEDAWKLYRAMLAAGRRPGRATRDSFGQ